MKKITLGTNKNRGLFSYLYTTFSCAYYCFINNEKFYIDWAGDKNYLQNNYGENIFNYWFDKPYKDEYDESVNLEEIYTFGLETAIDVIEENRIKWNKLLKEFMILKKDIKEEIDDFYEKNFFEKKILTVHKRGTDHYLHADILNNQYFFNIIDEEISKNNYDKIFLATDEENTLKDFIKKYGEKLIYFNHIRVNGTQPIFNNNVDKYKHGREVIKDCYLLSMGDKLIKTRSTISTFSCYLNKDLKYINIDSHIKWK
jgi:hypothetical protein